MTRRLVPYVTRGPELQPGPHLTPATRNVRFTEGIVAQRAPDPPRKSDFNTRPSRARFYHGGSNLSQFILREGFERAHVRTQRHRAGRSHIVSLPPGQMIPFRNPSGNTPDLAYMSWGSFLDQATQR